MYYKSINHVEIFQLKSVSDSYILQLLGNLYYNLSSSYANDLRSKYVKCHFERNIVLAESTFWLIIFDKCEHT